MDFDRFEYQFKDLDGKVVRRKRLGGILFLVEGLFFAALLRGDSEKARKELVNSSVTFLSSPGLVGKLWGAVTDHLDGRLSARSLRKRFEEFISSYFPQRTVLGVFEQLLSPEERASGFGDIPFLSKTGEVRIDPFTGKPKEPRRFISGTDIPAPAAVGSRVLSAELSPEEEFLRAAGIERVRAPQIRVAGGTTPETQEKFERAWGRLHGQLARGLMRKMPSAVKSPKGRKVLRKLYQSQRAKITQIVKVMLRAEGVKIVGPED